MEITKLKSTIIEMKNSLAELNNRLERQKKRTTDPEDRLTQLNLKRGKKKKLKKNEQSFGDLRDNIKKSKICVTGETEGEERAIKRC